MTHHRKDQLAAMEFIHEEVVDVQRHYEGSTASMASRATVPTGKCPSLHGDSQTNGTSKNVNNLSMMWQDTDPFPGLGVRVRAMEYMTHYRGK